MKAMLLGLVLSAAMAWPAAADDRDDITGVIQSQIEAFLADDFATAFTFASPGIKQMFGSSDRFGRMVREGYPMVWRPETVRFLELREISGALRQKVLIEDANGATHVLDYRMEPDGAGDWRIDGVQILRAPDVSA